MSTADALRNIATGQKKIKANGEQVTIERPAVSGLYDPEEQEAPPTTSPTFILWVAPVSATSREAVNANLIDGEKLLYIEGGRGYYPKIGDKIPMTDKTYRLLEIVNDFKRSGLFCAFLVKIGK